MRTDGPSSRAVVLHDPRSFLVRTLDHGLASRSLSGSDVDQLETDIVNMTLRYLTHRGWDVRDPDAGYRGAGIVIMYANDGLEILSSGNLDAAVQLIETLSLETIFRASYGRMEKLRQTHLKLLRESVYSLNINGLEVALHAAPLELQRPGNSLSSYADEDLLASFEKRIALAQWRNDLQQKNALVEQHIAAFRLLPLDEAAKRWRLIADNEGFAVSAEGLPETFSMAWLGACIRAMVRNDFGIVVCVADVEKFLLDHVEPLSGEGDFQELMAPTIDEATRRLSGFIAARHADGDAGKREGLVRWAVTVAIDHLNGIFTNKRAHYRASPFPEWVDWWRSEVFLELTNKEHTRILDGELIAPPDQLIERYRESSFRDEQLRIMDVLKLETAPVDTIIALLDAVPALGNEICSRVNWDSRTCDDLRACFTGSLDEEAMLAVARAIVTRRANLRGLPSELVYDCLLQLNQDERDGPALRRRLFDGWRRTAIELLSLFREAASDDERMWWLQFAAESPQHFAYLLTDALPCELALIQEVVRQDTNVPHLTADVLAAFFLWMEDKARKRRALKRRSSLSRIFANEDDPSFLDRDLRKLWPHLSSQHQAAVRQAFAHWVSQDAKPAPHQRK